MFACQRPAFGASGAEEGHRFRSGAVGGVLGALALSLCSSSAVLAVAPPDGNAGVAAAGNEDDSQMSGAVGAHLDDARPSRAYLAVRAGFSLAGEAEPLQESWLESPYVTLGVHYRWPSIDLGGYVGYLGSGRFDSPTSGARPRLGDQLLVALGFRWHFIDASWGSLFVGADLGLMVMEQTAEAQRSHFSEPRDISSSVWNPGVLFAGSVGATFEIAGGVNGVVMFKPVMGFGSVETEFFGDDYVVSAFVAALGVEFGL